ncbi:hypothetical protein BD289DRAFT_99517 [Coniella lustricola]|uniref:Secreted protein n=1 Tax=Coniella lustricola TaxID=2025994 RepID=A0A2T3AN77_9PEZI|nr:hypothetical protein BD289DRAFT_99517 [Coniella lustricola]
MLFLGLFLGFAAAHIATSLKRGSLGPVDVTATAPGSWHNKCLSRSTSRPSKATLRAASAGLGLSALPLDLYVLSLTMGSRATLGVLLTSVCAIPPRTPLLPVRRSWQLVLVHTTSRASTRLESRVLLLLDRVEGVLTTPANPHTCGFWHLWRSMISVLPNSHPIAHLRLF